MRLEYMEGLNLFIYFKIGNRAYIYYFSFGGKLAVGVQQNLPMNLSVIRMFEI